MPTSDEIKRAVESVRDQETFIQVLLKGALDWPVRDDVKDMGEISYDWTPDEIHAKGLSEKLKEGVIRQIRPLGENPWSIFLLEFKHPDAFTTGRGFTGPLRGLLRGLVSKRKSASIPEFKSDNLLFICTHNYEYYRFACFQPPVGQSKTAPLAIFGWDKDDTALRTLCEYNLKGLVGPNTRGEWKSAFDVKRLTDRFYGDYETAFTTVKGLIESNSDLRGDDLNLYTQILFNRLMFLRFVERKGWLEFKGNKVKYLQSLFNAGGIGGKSIYLSRAKSLFFEGLRLEGRQESEAIGKVKFLNGGLFEIMRLDSRVTDIPDEAFKHIIGNSGLYYQYNFTIQESTPFEIEVAVDPEMLGKVFEKLVTTRKKTGAYYTPREVVSFMCKETLKGYLGGFDELVDNADASDISVSQAKQLLKKLKSLKVIDPACGSGAYLVGMLHELQTLNGLLDTKAEEATPRDEYNLKLSIIQSNLYGVDLVEFAVNTACLRLWLSLAVEFPGDNPPPLPNLDFKIRLGDSLTAPDPQKEPQLDLFRQQTVRDYETTKAAHSRATDAKLKEELSEKIAEARKQIAEWKHPKVKVAGFDWGVEFAEAFLPKREDGSKGGGFDIAIANPPYGVLVEEKVRDQYFDKKKDAPQSRDSYGIFMTRALQLLRDGGQFSFIVSDTWRTIKSHRPLRKRLLEQTAVKHVLDLPSWIFDATVNTCILTLTKEAAKEDHQLIAGDLRAVENYDWKSLSANLLAVANHGFDAQTLTYARYSYLQKFLLKDFEVPVYVASPHLYDRLFSAETTPLEQLPADVRKGIDTGENHYFLYQNATARGTYRPINDRWVLTPTELDALSNYERQNGVLRATHNGRFVVPYDKGGESDAALGWLPNYFVESDYFIDWSRNAVTELRLRANRVIGEQPATLRNENYWFRKGITFSTTGFYAPTFRVSGGAMFDNKGATLFTNALSINQLLGLLCSRLQRFVLKNYIDHTVMVHVDELKRVPISIGNADILMQIEKQVDSIIEKQRIDPRYSYYLDEQRTIDELVYRLYQLDQEGIREIELWFCRRYPKLAEAQGFTVEVKRKYADYLQHCELVLSKPPSYWKSHPALTLIAQGEGQHIEFKETLEWDIKLGKPNTELRAVTLKEICAFANADGGTVLLGVSDPGEIKGLDRDFKLIAKHPNKDGFELKLRDLVNSRIKPSPIGLLDISFHDFPEGVACRVDVKRSDPIVHLDGKEVYVRDGNRTLRLEGQQLTDWIKNRK